MSPRARSTASTPGGVSWFGARLAEHLSLRVGDKITLIAPRGAETPFGVTPRVKSYAVAAIFQISMATFDNTFVFMPLAERRRPISTSMARPT